MCTIRPFHFHSMNCLINMTFYLTTLFLGIWVNVAVSAESVCPGPLPDVSNARVTDESRKDQYKEGDVINFACQIGYITAGRAAYECKKTKWTSTRKGKCLPKPCELPGETANGHYIIHDGDDFVFGATIKYTCNDGYQMVSIMDTRTCMLEGWSNHLPICEVVSCVLEATDGRVVVSGIPDENAPILFGHELLFSCPKPEHHLKGSPRVVCTAGGNWSNHFPTCDDVTCNVGIINENKVKVKGVPQNNDTMKYGHKLQFECSNPKHVLQGEPEVVCSTNGQWSHPFPQCREKTDVCGPPPIVNNGDTKNYKKEYKNTESVDYVCQKYYILSGQSFKTCENGIWIGEMTCLAPCTVDDQLMAERNIQFAHRTADPNKLYCPHGDVIGFKCTGHKRLSSNSVELRQLCNNGVMNLPRYERILVRKAQIESHNNGKVIVKILEGRVVSCVLEATDGRVVVSGIPDENAPILFGHELLFSCPKPEHHLKGSPRVVCTADGSWSNHFPTCDDVTCNVEMNNNVIATMKYGQKIQLECSNPKHVLQGEPEVVCSTNGQWSHPFPQCRERTDPCGPPPIVNNGDTKNYKKEYKNTESVDYVCQKYYILSGQSFKTCENGIWIGEMTCLAPCTVDGQLMAERNIQFAHRSADPNKLYAPHGDVIGFRCTGHKRLSSNSVELRQLCNNGVMNLPRCE
ncbi:hypothetical protein DPEC_G00337890 [Dallia pectoralis]|uniref:Uncharacterized protein n=1 Tax=Dallia pectoralis TaxID=75939 RepID=A0ACC2F4G8_DALPE|nr:hypothetical protein DPEC_G00337890 [Dallia pectoralis]